MRIETHNTAAQDNANAAAKNRTAAEPATASIVAQLDVEQRQEAAEAEQALPREGGSTATVVEGEQLTAAVRSINDYVQQVQRTLQFSIDDDTGTTIVKVLDSSTDEVIRQFPPEEALALARHLQASQETQARDTNGLFLHARA